MRRTITDWLTLAGRAPVDPIAVERCLDQAVALAASCHDWRTILHGIAAMEGVSRARMIDVANRTLDAACSERDLWGFRDVAALRAAPLEDSVGARAALEAGLAALGNAKARPGACPSESAGRGAARGYEWVLLGKGFVETLQDEEGMRRCLEAGRDGARAQRRPGDLADVAVEWAKRVDGDAGAALLREAEEMADPQSLTPWSLSSAWHSLGDFAAARRALETALQGATSCDAARHVARAWASRGDLDEARRALVRAEELANTADEWLECGEVALDAGLGEEIVRQAVEGALARCADDESRGRVSRAFHQWLGDEEAAARVGPRGVRPSALREKVRTLHGWETSAAGLFDWLRARATPDVLSNIARADYGIDADKHLAALRDICETGLVPRTLGWEPHEVVALTRWSSGENVNHLERALCCTLLCLAPAGLDELVTDGPILAESCRALGVEASHLAELFFAWRSETEASVDANDPDEAGPEQPIALLLLFLLRTASTPDDARLEDLAGMLTEHATYPLQKVAEWMAGSMRPDLWTDLIDGTLVPRRETHPATARVLEALGR